MQLQTRALVSLFFTYLAGVHAAPVVVENLSQIGDVSLPGGPIPSPAAVDGVVPPISPDGLLDVAHAHSPSDVVPPLKRQLGNSLGLLPIPSLALGGSAPDDQSGRGVKRELARGAVHNVVPSLPKPSPTLPVKVKRHVAAGLISVVPHRAALKRQEPVDADAPASFGDVLNSILSDETFAKRQAIDTLSDAHALVKDIASLLAAAQRRQVAVGEPIVAPPVPQVVAPTPSVTLPKRQEQEIDVVEVGDVVVNANVKALNH